MKITQGIKVITCPASGNCSRKGRPSQANRRPKDQGRSPSRPKKHKTTGTGDLFRARRHQIINMRRELVQLAGKVRLALHRRRDCATRRCTATMVGLEDTVCDRGFLLMHILAWMIAGTKFATAGSCRSPRQAGRAEETGHARRHLLSRHALAGIGGSPPFAGNCSFLSGAIFPHAGLGKFRPYGVRAARAAARHG
jgi:hypothetical protein